MEKKRIVFKTGDKRGVKTSMMRSFVEDLRQGNHEPLLDMDIYYGIKGDQLHSRSKEDVNIHSEGNKHDEVNFKTTQYSSEIGER